ncbi:MAG: glycosyl transferase [Gammaproteobacteria bacterium]|jgi:glycosyltransferase involved in cell wall biosynthesis|nr:glycosyl transferase [Gammaproteobacteria bacterium]
MNGHSRYDYVILNHLPSFYKINLYNELAKKMRIHVIFLGKSASYRPSDFTKGEMQFEHSFLYEADFDCRPKLKTCWQLLVKLAGMKFNKIIVWGWELPEAWLVLFTHSKNKNMLAMESSICDSKLSGWKAWLKKIFISRLSGAMCSGTLHKQLLQYLGFKGKCYITQGVGIFNRVGYQTFEKNFSGKFLFVGRLAKEKNLELLIQAFNQLPQYQLSIVGEGPLLAQLKAIAKANIRFLPYTDNHALSNIYLEHDVFVLTSVSEPWGLVVEEALFYGLPVIVSDRVACHPELVLRYQSGLIIDPNSQNSLIEAINTIAKPSTFRQLQTNVKAIDLSKRDCEQIAIYQTALLDNSIVIKY